MIKKSSKLHIYLMTMVAYLCTIHQYSFHTPRLIKGSSVVARKLKNASYQTP